MFLFQSIEQVFVQFHALRLVYAEFMVQEQVIMVFLLFFS